MATYISLADLKDDTDGADISDTTLFTDPILTGIRVRASAMIDAECNLSASGQAKPAGWGFNSVVYEERKWRFDVPIIYTRFKPIRWIKDLQLALAIDDSEPTGFAQYGIDVGEVRWLPGQDAPKVFGKVFVSEDRTFLQSANPIYGMPPVTFWALPQPLALLSYTAGFDWGMIPVGQGTAPTSTPTVTPIVVPQPNVAGVTYLPTVDAGSHVYAISNVFGSMLDDWRVGESVLTTRTAAVQNTASLTGNQLTNIPLGPTGTVARRIYRTLKNDDSGLLHFVGELSDNVGTTFTDQMPDASLPFLWNATSVTSAPDGLSYPYPPWLTESCRKVCRALINDQRLAFLDGLEMAKVADTTYRKAPSPRTQKAPHPSVFPQEARDILDIHHDWWLN